MKKRMLLSSIMMIVLCVSLISGATFALFTSESKTNITIQSGKVEVVSIISDLKTYSLDVEQQNGLFENGGLAVLDNEKGTVELKKVTPGDKATFKLVIENKSNVSVKYCVKYFVSGDLAEGLLITETEGGNTSEIKSQLSPEWTLVKEAGQLHEKLISIELPKDAGNEYQNMEATVEIAVYAVQGNDPSWAGEADTAWYNDTDTEFVLDTPAELQGLSQLVAAGNTFNGKTIKLGADIDLATTYGLYELQPIGNSTYSFQGTFDGQNHTISNLKLTSNPNKSNIGLFGMTTVGEIKNLIVENAEVKGRLNVGVVAGTPYTSKYTNITVKGLVKVDGMAYVGGVGGKNAYANWDNITVDVENGSYVKAVSTENDIQYRTYVGGVIGFMGEGTHKVTNVKSNIDVYGDVCDAGGIVGIAHEGNGFENIEHSGKVVLHNPKGGSDAFNDGLEVGAIAGVWMNNGRNVTFDNCTSTGTVKSSFVDSTGALVEITALQNNGLIGKGYYASYSNKLLIDGVEQVAATVEKTVSIEGVEYSYAATEEAMSNAISSGKTNIYLPAGDYVIPSSAQGKTLTIKGTADTKVAVKKVGSGGENCDYGFDGSTVTFDGITINTNSSTYIGYARLSATYNNCTFNGTYTLYGNSEFNNCTFNVSGDVYNIWTWGAPNATFNSCTFNSDGKALLLYGTENTKLTLNNCTFNDNGGLDDLKAAVEIGNDYNKSYTLIVNKAIVNGYEINDKGINTGTTLWANKNSMSKEKLNVVVDGVDVY